jgi:hypothetical protein
MYEGKSHTLFAKYAVPQMIGLLFNSVYMIVDGVFIGNRLGRDAMAAAAVSVPLVEILIALSMAVATGAGVLISSHLGQGEKEKARHIFSLAALCTAVMGLLISVLGNIFIHPLAELLGSTPVIHDEAISYMWYIITFSPFLLFSFLLSGLVRNDNRPKLAMFALMFGSVSNIVLDYVFMYLYQILRHYSDSEHPLTTQQILKIMDEKYHIQIHRVSVQNYVEILNSCGIKVNQQRAQDKYYYLDDRTFDIPELKLMIDAVQASHFIPEDKTNELIDKLLTLTSDYNADRLRENIYFANKVKVPDSGNYVIVESISKAIHAGKKISFQYFEYDVNKNRVLRHDGKPYIISPYTMIWNGDYYYVVGFYDGRQEVNGKDRDFCKRRRAMWFTTVTLKNSLNGWANASISARLLSTVGAPYKWCRILRVWGSQSFPSGRVLRTCPLPPRN